MPWYLFQACVRCQHCFVAGYPAEIYRVSSSRGFEFAFKGVIARRTGRDCFSLQSGGAYGPANSRKFPSIFLFNFSGDCDFFSVGFPMP